METIKAVIEHPRQQADAFSCATAVLSSVALVVTILKSASSGAGFTLGMFDIMLLAAAIASASVAARHYIHSARQRDHHAERALAYVNTLIAAQQTPAPQLPPAPLPSAGTPTPPASTGTGP